MDTPACHSVVLPIPAAPSRSKTEGPLRHRPDEGLHPGEFALLPDDPVTRLFHPTPPPASAPILWASGHRDQSNHLESWTLGLLLGHDEVEELGGSMRWSWLSSPDSSSTSLMAPVKAVSPGG
jgi:hypothetical protein